MVSGYCQSKLDGKTTRTKFLVRGRSVFGLHSLSESYSSPFADKVTETPGEILNTPFVFLSELAPCNLRRCTYWYAVERIVIVTSLPQNVLMQIEDDTSLKDVENQESQDPSVPITRNNGDVTTLVYGSRSTILELSGHPILTDFGQIRLVEGCVNQDWWMPDLYRAQEVLLQLPCWGFPVDIWSIGVMTLELLEGKNLFDPIDHVHCQWEGLTDFVLLPNVNLLLTKRDDRELDIRSPNTRDLFRELCHDIPPGEEKDQVLRFIRKILTWDQEARATSNEIILDEWLTRPVEAVV
ncbi:protein kinase [Histoplasma capsulatum]|uniref:Protein kinase n=1 Tax=Ajellomyces capsulatus TaxID=5037 RepID=A0A8A1MNS5_AJECA|nr:protein kinase [Histoplasma capsulatum]